MDRRFRNRPFISDPEEPEIVSTENGPDSPSSGDDYKIVAAPSFKKSRRGGEKKVISVPIGDVAGSKSKGEAYPPSDSWAWRKYGQKPIKGSPYPRGYYRCSSSKGCPARKQVERSRIDPTKLLITYAFDHNHTIPTKSHNQSSLVTSSTPLVTSDSSTIPATPEPFVVSPAKELTFFPRQTDLELSYESTAAAIIHNHHWFDDVASMVIFDNSICTHGISCLDDDAIMSSSIGWENEDESLFADLGELPECSVVFRRKVVESKEQNLIHGLNAVSCCGSIG